MLRVIVVGTLVVLAVLAAARWLSGKTDETSDAVSRSITTPIDRAARAEAESNVRSAMSAAQIYFVDNGTYAGISAPALRAIDASLSPTVQVFATGAGYCLMATVPGVSVRNGPSAEITDGSCLSG
jgi:hypothetical protein